jgi:hypothetical protein
MVCWNLCHAHLKEVGLTQIPTYHGTLLINLSCKNPCRFFIRDSFCRLLDIHLLVWSELGRLWPFWPMKDLRMQWSWAFSLVCQVVLRAGLDYMKEVHRSRLLGWNAFFTCQGLHYGQDFSGGWLQAWMTKWQYCLLREVYGGQVSWATSNPRTSNWTYGELQLNGFFSWFFVGLFYHFVRHTNRCLKITLSWDTSWLTGAPLRRRLN